MFGWLLEVRILSYLGQCDILVLHTSRSIVSYYNWGDCNTAAKGDIDSSINTQTRDIYLIQIVNVFAVDFTGQNQ